MEYCAFPWQKKVTFRVFLFLEPQQKGELSWSSKACRTMIYNAVLTINRLLGEQGVMLHLSACLCVRSSMCTYPRFAKKRRVCSWVTPPSGKSSGAKKLCVEAARSKNLCYSLTETSSCPPHSHCRQTKQYTLIQIRQADIFFTMCSQNSWSNQ